MAEPRPTFFEGYMLVVAHLFRGLSVLCLVVALLAFVIDLIAFSKMDEQVLHYLRERVKATGNKTLFITHQQIADELYTSREVISRLLRSMENKGLVRIGRSSIELLNGKKNHNHTVA